MTSVSHSIWISVNGRLSNPLVGGSKGCANDSIKESFFAEAPSGINPKKVFPVARDKAICRGDLLALFSVPFLGLLVSTPSRISPLDYRYTRQWVRFIWTLATQKLSHSQVASKEHHSVGSSSKPLDTYIPTHSQ